MRLIKNKKVTTIIATAGLALSAGFIIGIGGWFGGGGSIPSDTFTRGLVGYWSFDEGGGQTTYDASAEGNNGTLGSAASAGSDDPQWTTGKNGGALEFDGSDDYVDCGNPSIFQSFTKLTIEAWVNRAGNGANGLGTIVNKDDNLADAFFWLYWTDGGAVTTNWGGSAGHDSFGFNDTSTGVWRHIVFTFDAGTAALYEDGMVKASKVSAVTDILSPDTNLTLGNYAPWPYFTFNGLIDEVRIYNRALSAEEIRYHYNRGGPVAHWAFDEGHGTTTYDGTDNDNDGTMGDGTCSPGSGTCPTWTTGMHGMALAFDGTDDYVSQAYDSDFDFGAGSFSISAWFKHQGQGQGSSGTLDLQVAAGDSDAHEKADNTFFERTDHVVEIYSNPSGNSRSHGGFHFDSVNIPQGSTVDTAYIQLYQYSHSDDDMGAYIYGNDVDNANDFLAEADVTDRDTTSAYVPWIVDDVSHYAWVTSPEIKTVIQEIVDRDGWSANNDIVILIKGLTFINSYFDAASYESSAGAAYTAKLHIEYGGGGGGAQNYLASRYSGSGWKLWSEGDDIYFGIDDDSTWGPDDSICSSGKNYGDGSWHHLEAVKDGTSAVYLYVDGQKVAETHSLSATGSLSGSSPSLYIGSDSGAASTWQGIIDDVRIYNYARTVDEIALDYNAGFAAHFGPKSGCDDDPGSCMDLGLVGYWGMEEGDGDTAYDASLYSNDGTLTNNPTWTTGIKPLSGGQAGGGALEFDGKDDYVDAGNDSSLDITSSITMEGWVNYKFLPNDRYVQTASKWGSYEWAQYDYTANTIACSIRIESVWKQLQYSAANINLNAWYHIIATYDGNNFKFYINGNLVDSTSTSGNIDSNLSNSVWLGAWEAGDRYFDGLIDEVRIYNRALSAEEIRYHYNRGGPVALWKFDEGSGTTVYDSTENNNDGAWNGTGDHWATGKYGTAGQFNGTDDYVDCGNDASLNITTDAITLEAWFKTSVPGPPNWQVILSKWGTNVKWTLYEGAGNKLRARLQFGTAGEQVLSGISVVNDDIWHHVAMTFDGTDWNLYVDGALEASDNSYAGDTIDADASVSLRIGNLLTDYMTGLIDDVRIYNYARTEDQIKQDYNMGMAVYFGPQSGCDEDPASCMDYGLVGHWGMEEGGGTTAYDSSDYSNDGRRGSTSADDPSDPTWTTGIKSLSGGTSAGSALEFDGQDDYVNAGNHSSFDITDELTMEVWVNMAELDSDNKAILRKGSSYVVDASYNNIRFFIFDTGASNNIAQIAQTSDMANSWMHIVGTYKDRVVTLYVDGVQEDQETTTGGDGLIEVVADDLTIGSWLTQSYFNGLIDEVRIYSRALSAEEVRYHYNRGEPVAHWRFDEGSGQIAFDESANNNDGTLGTGTGVDNSDPTWIEGKVAGALSFDGVDDYVEIANAASITFDAGAALTIEAWVKRGAIGSIQEIVSKLQNYIFRFTAANKLNFNFYDGTAWRDIGGGVQSITDTTTWHHVVVAYDDPNDVQYFYIDGSLDSEVANAYVIEADTDNLVIGATDPTANYFDGLIDEVRIYNYVRTPLQILEDYNSGLGVHFK